MKKSALILFAILLFTNSTFANTSRNSKIPHAVLKEFSEKYPDTKVDRWKNTDDTFVARFFLNKRKQFAFYTNSGTWIKTETKIPWTWNLPHAVKSGWESCKFNAWYIEEMHEVASSTDHYFVFKIDNGDMLDSDHHDAFLEKYVLYFDGNGKLIRKQPVDN